MASKQGLSFDNAFALYVNVANLTLGTLVAILYRQSWMTYDEGE
jgi:hypothetical protein